MLAWLITWSLRNRYLVLAWFLAHRRLRRPVAAARSTSTPSRTPRRCRCRSTPSRPSLVPEEVERQITFPVELAISGMPGLQAGALALAVRPVAGHRHLRRRHRHLLRPPADQRATGHGASCRRASTARRWGRSPPAWARCCTTSSPSDGMDLTDLRTMPGLDDSSRRCGRCPAPPRSTPGAASRSSTRCASIRCACSSTTCSFDEVIRAVRSQQPQRRRRQPRAGRRDAARPRRRPDQHASSRSRTS